MSKKFTPIEIEEPNIDPNWMKELIFLNSLFDHLLIFLKIDQTFSINFQNGQNLMSRETSKVFLISRDLISYDPPIMFI